MKIYNLLYLIMDRPTWDETFMAICEIISHRSTCLRIKTSAIIVKNLNIIAIGYNGVYIKNTHCSDYWLEQYKINYNSYSDFTDFVKSNDFYIKHHEWSNNNELHAEMNAIINAGKNNSSCENAIIYTLYAPCINCAKIIIASKINTVIYKHEYDRNNFGKILLLQNDITIKKI